MKKEASGAYRRRIKTELIEVMTKPRLMLPFANLFQNRTIAVHGETARRITPMAYPGFAARMVLAKKKPRKGLIIQFAMRVITSGLGNLMAFLISPYSILMRVGNIMKNKQMAIGMENPANWSPARVKAKVGKSHPNSSPRAMNESIQRVRYFSKSPIWTDSSSSELTGRDLCSLVIF
jgi:hypothetical protein